jgi:hypothetical protein
MSTDFLFASPSFLTGVARLFDLAGVFDSYNESLGPDRADALATFADWRTTGEDLARVMAAYREEAAPQQLRLDLGSAGVETP